MLPTESVLRDLHAQALGGLNATTTEQLQAAYAAFEDPEPMGLAGCFLSRLYGPKLVAVREWLADDNAYPYADYMAARLNMTAPQAEALLHLFEFDRKALCNFVRGRLGLEPLYD